MPKKRKKTSKNKRRSPKNTRDTRPAHELPGGFWRQILAVLLLGIALFAIVTWFGHGGTALSAIHTGCQNVIGVACYLIPILLVYLAVKIFRAEDNRVAIPVYIASVLTLLWVSGLAGVWSQGGFFGNWLSGLLIDAIGDIAPIFLYLILIFITLAFLLQLSPVTFFKGTKNLMRPRKKSAKTAAAGGAEASADQPRKAGRLEIKVNSGLGAPVDTTPIEKNKKSAPAETAKEPQALTVQDDPDWKTPPLSLLEKKQSSANAGDIEQNAYIIKNTLS